MPAYRLVYVQDDIGRPETVTANFESSAEAAAALAARGLRVLYVAALRRGELASDPVTVPMAAEAAAPAQPARGGRASNRSGAGTMAGAGAR